MKLSILGLSFSFLLLMACSPASAEKGESQVSKTSYTQAQLDSMDIKKAYFASGCFWCVEAIFESVQGVKEAVSGYAGGTTKNPTYREVGTGRTGHAETVEVYYDPEVVDFKTLVKVYYGSHDPTAVNRQGPDVGTAYRSIAFYQNAEEKKIIEDYIAYLESEGGYKKGDIATEVKKLDAFYDAEDYHQDYERKHPDNRYIQVVSIPRLKRFQKKYPELLKQNSH